MISGYCGKLLYINLSNGNISEESPEESFYRKFLGGYGIGARILYSHQKAGIDPLGPENILGFVTGPLTGTPAIMGCRYTAVAKSPLTGGWGDSNSGGNFGPVLKFAGYDGIFFFGISEKPVYLFIEDGKAELRDASHLWGKNTYQTEDELLSEHGKGAEIICIGTAGEKKSLLSGIFTRRIAAAGRSGLGAVMGSKKLKAVAVKGSLKIPIADSDYVNQLRSEHLAEIKSMKSGSESAFEKRHKYGTSAATHIQAHSGDSPVKNWGGIGIIDFPDSSGLSGDAAIANLERRIACWHCPLGCKAVLKEGRGEYYYPSGVRRPEYETQAAFGTMCLNNNTESIAMVNYLCDNFGLDTISVGTTIAFAIECFDKGLINKSDTDGIELSWGDHNSIVTMTEKLAKREGFGDILADGVKLAAGRIGKGASKYAVHIGGQELGMHDPKMPAPPVPYFPGQPPAARYQMDATPGRHTQGFGPLGFSGHIVNLAGLCQTGYIGPKEPIKLIAGYISAVTGWKMSDEELFQIAERVVNLRHVFNLREGINPLNYKVHPRIIGSPPQKTGPLAGVKADIKDEIRLALEQLQWDHTTTKPAKEKLLELGLDDLAQDLWP
ncbi:MAG: aldehyde ferredoxin oxidoreductase family protein [Dehalococcoidia bacterium]